ncbi:patatin-like phospholipase family protein [soil metagenome]
MLGAWACDPDRKREPVGEGVGQAAMARVGLVLGAGGVVGQAYHAGVLAALEHDLGWDPRTADVIVGSSAGSVTGTLLRIGVGASDLAAYAVEAPLSGEAQPFFDQLPAEPLEFPPFELRNWLRPWRPPSAALLARLARRPWAFRPGVAAMALMPSGLIDLARHTEVVQQMAGDEWPDGLWLCAARRRDGGRVVFGRAGAPPAPLGLAVAASCAIPGYFAPVRIGGVPYFDGGVHSPTNADVLRDTDMDLVIVVSPMSASHGRARTVDAAFRWSAHRRLEREVKRLRSRGMEVVRIEPGGRSLAAMGVNAMAIDRSDRVVQASFLEAGSFAGQGAVAQRLALIASRPSRRHRATG